MDNNRTSAFDPPPPGVPRPSFLGVRATYTMDTTTSSDSESEVEISPFTEGNMEAEFVQHHRHWHDQWERMSDLRRELVRLTTRAEGDDVIDTYAADTSYADSVTNNVTTDASDVTDYPVTDTDTRGRHDRGGGDAAAPPAPRLPPEHPERFRIRLDLQGFPSDGIVVTVEDRTLTVRATHEERVASKQYQKRVCKSARLPRDTDRRSLRALLDTHGVLVLRGATRPRHNMSVTSSDTDHVASPGGGAAITIPVHRCRKKKKHSPDTPKSHTSKDMHVRVKHCAHDGYDAPYHPQPHPPAGPAQSPGVVTTPVETVVAADGTVTTRTVATKKKCVGQGASG